MEWLKKIICFLQGRKAESKGNQLESDVAYLISRQEAELVLGVNNAAYHGDLLRLKGLISAGADPSRPDYDGRTALVFELFCHVVIAIQTAEVHFH
jgi:hypothetical protein